MVFLIEISPGTIEVPPLGYGGAERVIFGLSKCLSKKTRCLIVDFSQTPQRIVIEGVTITRVANPLKVTRSRGLLAYSWNAATSAICLLFFIRRLKRGSQRPMLHFHNGVQFAIFKFLCPLFGIHIPQMIYSHHSPRWMDPSRIKAWEMIAAVPTELFALKHAYFRTYESLAVKKAMERYVGNKIHAMVLPNGVDTDVFDRKHYFQVTEPYGILYGARIKRQKDQLTVVRAFKDVLSKEPRASLLFIGDPEELDYYRQVRSEVTLLGLDGNVLFRGSVDIKTLNMVRTQYAINLVYSDYTGFDVAVGELLALGTACVFSDIPPLKGIAENGKNCILVPPHDAKTLAEGLLFLLNNPEKAERLRNEARKTAIEMLSWNVLSERFLNEILRSQFE